MSMAGHLCFCAVFVLMLIRSNTCEAKSLRNKQDVDARPAARAMYADYVSANTTAEEYVILSSYGLTAAFGVANKFLNKKVTRIVGPPDGISEQLDEMYALLEDTYQKIDDLSHTLWEMMRSLEQNHDVTRIVSAFSASVRRLEYFMLLIKDDLNFDETNQVQIIPQSMKWAEAVLAQRDDGIGPVLFDIHKMVTGSFGTEPIRDVYLNGLLLAGHPYLWEEMERLIGVIVELQNVGYSHWAIALDIRNRTDEKPQVEAVMNERLSIQEEYLLLEEKYRMWPQGSYGLVQATSGCPSGEWYTGARYHDTDDKKANNQWSPSNFGDYIRSTYDAGNFRWEFCMKPDTSGTDIQWPAGQYCLFAYGDCPAGFQRGSLYFDDEDKGNDNYINGEVPSGRYDHNTEYDFCCRNDADVGTEIFLPLDKPFVLFPRHDAPCQAVNNMVVTELYFFWDCEDKKNNNGRNPPYPRETDQGDNMRIYMCHYRFI